MARQNIKTGDLRVGAPAASRSKQGGVTTPRTEYTIALPFVERNRVAMIGERAVKQEEVATIYLPPLASMCCSTFELENGFQQIRQGNCLTGEGKTAYYKYLSLASWYGATGETVKGLVGLIQSKKPRKELDDEVEYLDENVDGKGTSLREFASDICKESFITPWSGILVDFPNVKQSVSKLQAEQNNLRPKLLFYKFESVINWHYSVVNNQQKLVLLVLKEVIQKRDGFNITDEFQYRVLELIDSSRSPEESIKVGENKSSYHQSVYNSGGERVIPNRQILVDGKPSDEIPFFWNDSGEEGGSILDPLIDMNFHHYRVSADYNGKNFYSSFAIFYETGAQPNNANNLMGAGVKWNNQSTDATFGVLQADGNADALRISQQDDEQRMAALGAEALRPRSSGVESAEAKSLDKVTQSSTTADVAITVSDIITKALDFASRWLGGEEDNTYRLNTDYVPTGMDANTLNALWATTMGGGMSYETFYSNLQRGEIADPDRTAEEEQELIAMQDTGMGGGGSDIPGTAVDNTDTSSNDNTDDTATE